MWGGEKVRDLCYLSRDMSGERMNEGGGKIPKEGGETIGNNRMVVDESKVWRLGTAGGGSRRASSIEGRDEWVNE